MIYKYSSLLKKPDAKVGANGDVSSDFMPSMHQAVLTSILDNIFVLRIE